MAKNRFSYAQAIKTVMNAIKINTNENISPQMKQQAATAAVEVVENSDANEILTNIPRILTEQEQTAELARLQEQVEE